LDSREAGLTHQLFSLAWRRQRKRAWLIVGRWLWKVKEGGGSPQSYFKKGVLFQASPAHKGHAATRSQSLPQVGKGLLRAAEKHQTKARKDSIKGVFMKGMQGGIGLPEQGRRVGPLAGPGQHNLAHIHAYGLTARTHPLGQLQGALSASATHIQNTFARPDGGFFHGAQTQGA